MSHLLIQGHLRNYFIGTIHWKNGPANGQPWVEEALRGPPSLTVEIFATVRFRETEE